MKGGRKPPGQTPASFPKSAAAVCHTCLPWGLSQALSSISSLQEQSCLYPPPSFSLFISTSTLPRPKDFLFFLPLAIIYVSPGLRLDSCPHFSRCLFSASAVSFPVNYQVAAILFSLASDKSAPDSYHLPTSPKTCLCPSQSDTPLPQRKATMLIFV